jgi:uncharacterized protein
MGFFVHHRDRTGSLVLRHPLLEKHWACLDRCEKEMIIRGPAFTGDGAPLTGSVCFVDPPGPAAARAFAFDAPGFRAGARRAVLPRRWHNMLGRTMWDFACGRADGTR